MTASIREQEASPRQKVDGPCVEHPILAIAYDDFTGGFFCRRCGTVWYRTGSSDGTTFVKVLLRKIQEGG